MSDREAIHRDEVSMLNKALTKAASWFPFLMEMLRMDKLCRLVGFSHEQTSRLLSNNPVEYDGSLYSDEHRRRFPAKDVTARIALNRGDKKKLGLYINGQVISDWFREQFGKMRQSMRQTSQGRGFRM